MEPIKALKILAVAFIITFSWMGVDYLNKRNEKIRIESENFVKSFDLDDEKVEDQKKDKNLKEKEISTNNLTKEEEIEAEKRIEKLNEIMSTNKASSTESNEFIKEEKNRLTKEEEIEAGKRLEELRKIWGE